MLKTGHEGLQKAMADLFDDILFGMEMPAEEWRRIKLKLIFKKGSLEIQQNYRLL